MEQEPATQQQDAQENAAPTVSYLQFDQVPLLNVYAPSMEQAAALVTQYLTPNADWKEQFAALDVMRSANKYHTKDFLRTIIATHFRAIAGLADSLRSNVSKNALMLVKEVFQVASASDVPDEAVRVLVHIVFQKSAFNQKFISSEAKEAIAALENNKTSSVTQGVIETLCDLCFDKSASICETACQSLNNILKANEENLQVMNESLLGTLTKTLAKNLQGKRAVLKKVSKDVCVYLNEKMGQQVFNSLENQDRKLVEQSITQGAGNNAKAQSLADFIKNKKNEMK